MPVISDLVGKPFCKDAMGQDTYCCWGLALEVFRRFGVELPDYRDDCSTVGTGVIKKSNQWVRCVGEIPMPALMVFTTAGIADHVGVYLGDGKFIHAHETAGVVITRTDHFFWKRRIEGYYVPGWLPDRGDHV